MLFGVRPTDPLTFGGLAAAVLPVAGVAALLPALKATRVDPAVSLRAEQGGRGHVHETERGRLP